MKKRELKRFGELYFLYLSDYREHLTTSELMLERADALLHAVFWAGVIPLNAYEFWVYGVDQREV